MAGEAEIIAGVTEGQNIDGLSDLQIVDNAIAAAATAASTDAGDESVTDDQTTDDVVNDAIADAEGEEVVADAEPAAKADEVEEPVAAKPTDEADDDVEADATNLSVSSLKTKISKSPELKTLMDKDPTFRNQVFQTARRAERANQYDELFQTPALAKEIKDAAEDQYQTRQLFEGEDSTKFLQKLIFNSLERGEDGKVKLDEVGRPISTGAYERHMRVYRDNVWGSIDNVAKKVGDKVVNGVSGDEIREALRIVKMIVGDAQDGGEAAAESEDAMPTQWKAELDRLRKLESDVKATTTTSVADFKSQVDTATHEMLVTDVKNLFAKRLPAGVAYSDYIKNVIVNDTVNEIEKMAKGNMAHQDVLSRGLRGAARTTDGVKKLVGIQQSFAKELIPRILAKVMTQATPGVVSQNATKHKTITAQNGRREVATSGGVSNPARPDAKLAAQTAIANAKKSGKPLSDMELVEAVVASQQR